MHERLKTQAVVDEVNRMRSSGVPVDGIGVNAVFEDVIPSGPLIADRIDRLAEAGVPIWITGYSFSHSDPAVQATALQDFLLAVAR